MRRWPQRSHGSLVELRQVPTEKLSQDALTRAPATKGRTAVRPYAGDGGCRWGLGEREWADGCAPLRWGVLVAAFAGIGMAGGPWVSGKGRTAVRPYVGSAGCRFQGDWGGRWALGEREWAHGCAPLRGGWGLPLSRGLTRGLEAVSHVPDCFYEGAARRFHLGTQAPHVNVNGAGAAQVVVSPDLAEQGIAGVDPAGVGGQ